MEFDIVKRIRSHIIKEISSFGMWMIFKDMLGRDDVKGSSEIKKDRVITDKVIIMTALQFCSQYLGWSARYTECAKEGHDKVFEKGK